MQPDATPEHPKRFNFDPTINLGHVLTFIGLALAMFAGWSALDKRVVVLEEAKGYQRERDNSQDNAIRDQLFDLKEAVREVKRSVDKLAERQPGPAR